MLDDVVENSNLCVNSGKESIGKYKGVDLYIKTGQYGLYAKWGTEMKSLKELGSIPIEKVEYYRSVKDIRKEWGARPYKASRINT